jgi:hypothetical protein
VGIVVSGGVVGRRNGGGFLVLVCVALLEIGEVVAGGGAELDLMISMISAITVDFGRAISFVVHLGGVES